LRGPFQLDELESFESNRYQPLTVAVLIERGTMFLVASAVGRLRRKGRLSEEQLRRRSEHEALHGRRPSHSAVAVRAVMGRLAGVTHPHGTVQLESDHKLLYGALGRTLLGARFEWRPHPASARRDRRNPLFPINHTNARLRHWLSRLRRRSWCVSKRGAALSQHLSIAALWSNYSRGITNRTRTTPAQALGLVEHAVRPEQLTGWRQDWGALSPNPLA